MTKTQLHIRVAFAFCVLSLGIGTVSGRADPVVSTWAGSSACEDCHPDIHAAWAKASHALTLRDADIIHVRRPDGRDLDCILHVNPRLKHKGLAMVYNPLDRIVKKQLKLPLYYTGLTKTAYIREKQGESIKYELDREYNVEIPVNIAPRSVSWFIIEKSR